MTIPGNLYIISAPSGTGKTSLVKSLIQSLPDITVSVSHTTRPKRPSEQHGVNYYFISQTEFDQMVLQDDFLEHATVFGYSYGTSRLWVEETLAQGKDVILEIDWQGCQQIQRLFPENISIFILPPSVNDLYQRLIKRNQDNHEIIKQRLADVKESTCHIHEYHYIIVNDDFSLALKDLQTIVQSGRLLQRCQAVRFQDLLSDLLSTKLDI